MEYSGLAVSVLTTLSSRFVSVMNSFLASAFKTRRKVDTSSSPHAIHGDYDSSVAQYRFSKKDVLGEGAYGAVYRAYDTSTNITARGLMHHHTDLPPTLRYSRPIALKQMSSTSSENGFTAAALREISSLKKLSTPGEHCVRVTQVGGYAPYSAVDPADCAETTLGVEATPPTGDATESSEYSSPHDAFLKGKDYVVELYDVIVDRSAKRVYLALELCEGGDLWHSLHRLPERRITDRGVFQRWMREMLWGVMFMHSRNISHRDLKPQNIMLQRFDGASGQLHDGRTANEFYLKIADFGLSRIEGIPVKKYVHSAVTLWYRSPDILLGNANFKYSADAWSLGCIMIEVACGVTLFRGKDEKEQLKRIFARLGGPTHADFPSIHDYPHSETYLSVLQVLEAQHNLQVEFWAPLVEEEGSHLQTIGFHTPPSLLWYLAAVKARLRHFLSTRGGMDVLGEEGLDLVARLLVPDPQRRLCVMDAAQHPFMSCPVTTPLLGHHRRQQPSSAAQTLMRTRSIVTAPDMRLPSLQRTPKFVVASPTVKSNNST